MRASKSVLAVVLAAGMALASAESAIAQTATSPRPATASTGSTEVALGGFQPVVKPAPDSKDGSQLRLTAGGLLSQGNSRSIAATVAGDYRLRQELSQLSVLTAINYGRSAASRGEPYQTSVENYQAKVRYDYFFTPEVAGFFSAAARRDRFQGLDLRLNVDPGVAYYFIDEKAEQFWLELGYDLQHDVRRDSFVQAALLDPLAPDIAKSQTSHSVRLFAGYKRALAENLMFDAGVEDLESVQQSRDNRLNIDLALTAKVQPWFSIASTVSVRYDNQPLPGVEKTDVVSALNLVYSLSR